MNYDKAKDFKPFKYLSPPSEAPVRGFYGTVTRLRTLDVNINEDTAEFVFTREELDSMDRGTLTFRAKDSGSSIAIKKCSVSGLKMVITLERRVLNYGKVQVEWKNVVHYEW